MADSNGFSRQEKYINEELKRQADMLLKLDDKLSEHELSDTRNFAQLSAANDRILTQMEANRTTFATEAKSLKWSFRIWSGVAVAVILIVLKASL